MSTYHLFSWGANSHGQLGQGDIPEEELPVPREVDLSSVELRPEEITKIVGGAGHSLILDSSGRVYSCGWNDKGQAGPANQEARFQRLDEGLEGRRVVDIACGWDASMALTDRGELFAWGSNSHGQLGLAGLASVRTPTKVQLELPVERLAMGLRHSAVVTKDLKLMVSGAATKGQLGIDLQGARSSSQFVRVTDLENVNDVSCGQHHTIVTTKDNQIFAWGDNKHGQLGIDPELYKSVFKPTKVENFKVDTASKIYSGWTHSVVLTSDKKVLCWGRNTYGQLGRAKTSPKTEHWKAKIPSTSMKIQQISVGSEHNITLNDDNTIWCWGWNEHGNCGNGNKEDIFEPSKVILPECFGVLVGTGAGHSFALVKIDC